MDAPDGAIGLDGIIAKRLDEPYRSGERTAMVKIKRIRTADCVVGGFRYAEKGAESVRSCWVYTTSKGCWITWALLPASTLNNGVSLKNRRALVGPPGFTGHAPGGPVAGAPSAPPNGNRSRPSWFARCSTITFLAADFAMAQNSCAGVPKRTSTVYV